MLKAGCLNRQNSPLLANFAPACADLASLADPGWGGPQGNMVQQCRPALPGWVAQSPVEIPALAFALGCGFFVASSAISVPHLSRLSRSTVRLFPQGLWSPAELLRGLLVTCWRG